jgi:hypothetical protein
MKRVGGILFGVAVLIVIASFLPMVPTRTPTQAEVERVLVVGASQDTLRKAFGKPLDFDRDSHGSGVALYYFPPRARASTNRLSGFRVFYESNRVVRWVPISGDRQ